MQSEYPDIRIYGPDDKRKAFPVDEVDSVTWEHLALGGFGECSVSFKETFATALGVAAGDRIEVWVQGSLRYRGFIGVRESNVDLADKKTLVAYGLAERMNSIWANKHYLSQAGMDASAWAQYLWQDWVQPCLPTSGTRLVTCPTTIYDLTAADTAREAFDKLIEASGDDCVWGWEVDALGQDQLFVIPRGTAAKYKFVVGGNVKGFSYPEDHSDVVNRVHVFGAQSKWPNLLTNPSFDDLTWANEVDGNMIGNESFEHWHTEVGINVPDGWAYGGATRKTDLVRTGAYSIGIEDENEFIKQYNIPVIGGRTYNVCCYLNRVTGHVEVDWPFLVMSMVFDQGGAAVPNVNLKWSDETWCRASCQFTAPAAATTVTLEIKINQDVSSLRLDDVSMWEEGAVAAVGWKQDSVGPKLEWWYGSCLTKWGVPGKPAEREHGHSAVVQLRPNLLRTVVTIPYSKALSVQPGDAVKACCYARTSAGTCKALMFDRFYGDETSDIVAQGSYFTLNSTSWTLLTDGVDNWAGLSPNAEKVRIGIMLRNETGSSAEVYIDTVYLMNDPLLEWNANNPPYFPDYLRADTHEWWLDTDDTFIQTDPAIDASIKASIATFGVREAELSVDYLDSLETAQTWAKTYFGQNALPRIPQKLDVVGCTTDVRCDGLVAVLGSGKAAAFPVRVAHTLRAGADATDVTIELDVLRPSWQGLLASVLTAAARKAKLSTLR